MTNEEKRRLLDLKADFVTVFGYDPAPDELRKFMDILGQVSYDLREERRRPVRVAPPINDNTNDILPDPDEPTAGDYITDTGM